ncbi:MAG TPA: hypothetical protein VIK13_17365 [Candidatus Limnocylindrales bacterium]
MVRDRDPGAGAVLSPGVKRGVVAASFIGLVAVVSYLGSPNNGHDAGTALGMTLAVAAVIVALLAARWVAVRSAR